MLARWRIRLKALFRREAIEAEFDEELRYHFERETERYVARGLSVEEARRAARRDLGDPGRLREEARETWRWRWLDELLQDLRSAKRGLVGSAGYTIVAALSLGFGIGATSTLFSVVDALDLRALPYRDADRLVWLAELMPPTDRSCPGCPLSTSRSKAAQWHAQARSFEALAFWSRSDVHVRQGDVSDYVRVGYASPGLLELLGVHPLFGRGIMPEDTVRGAEPVALLSYAAWQSRFGGNRGVLGSRFEYYDDPALTEFRTATIVGVLPEDFRFGWGASVWLALGDGAGHFVDGMARLRPGVAPAAAEAELRAVAARLAEIGPDGGEAPMVTVRPLRERLGVVAGRGRLLLFGITTLVLLVAVMNVAGVSLARTLSRQTELTVRATLGASPLRLVRQMLVEGVCLGAVGGVIGALLAVWGVRVAGAWFRLEGTGLAPRFDHRVLAFSAGAAVLVGIMTALLPSVRAARSNLYGALRDRAGAAGRPHLRRVTGGLLAAQIASGLVLVTGAGVLGAEYLKLRYLDLGFEPHGLYRVILFDGPDRRAAPEGWRPTLEEARRRAARVAGVEGVALRHESALAPAVVRPDAPAEAAAREQRTPRVNAVDVGYFRTFRATIRAGRGFTAADRRGGRPVCILNAAAAGAFWQGASAVGRRVFVGDSTGAGEWLTVVGVAADIEKGDMVERHWPTVYRPLGQAPLYHRAASLFVRLAGPPEFSLPALQRAVAEATGHPAGAFHPVSQTLDRRYLSQRFNAIALNVFAAFAILLAAMGIYGSVAYTVARRTREIGVRMALGAEKARVLRLVASQTMGMAAAGLALGLLGAVALTRVLRAFVSATSGVNPWMLAAAAILVGVVALLATYLPARRAAAVDPLIALRSE